MFLSLTRLFNAPKVLPAIPYIHKLNVWEKRAVHKVCAKCAVLTLITASNAKRVMWVTEEFAQILVLLNLLLLQKEIALSVKTHAMNAARQVINALSVKMMYSASSNWILRKMSVPTDAPMEQLWGETIQTFVILVRLSASRAQNLNLHVIHATTIERPLRIYFCWKTIA